MNLKTILTSTTFLTFFTLTICRYPADDCRYPDDVQLPIGSVLEGLALLSLAAQQVKSWAEQLSLKLNAGKIRAIFFGSSGYVQRLRVMNLPGVCLEAGITIPFVNEVKSLGVILGSKLSWRPQINSVTKKVSRALKGLKYIKSCTTEVHKEACYGSGCSASGLLHGGIPRRSY